MFGLRVGAGVKVRRRGRVGVDVIIYNIASIYASRGRWITYGMSSIDTSINDIGADSRSSTVIISVASNSTLAVGDASNTPSSAVLGNVGIDSSNTVFLDKGNLKNN